MSFASGADVLGTYEFSVRALNSGFTNAQSLVLVDSADRQVPVMSGSAVNTLTPSPPGGWRAQRGVICAMVDGHIYVEPSTWAIGNIMAIGVSIGAFEQDMTGVATVDSLYTMWNNATPAAPAAHWSNDNQRTNLWSRRQYKGFSSNDATIMVVPVRARLRVRLREWEALMVWLELESTSVNVRYQTWLRTLVLR